MTEPNLHLPVPVGVGVLVWKHGNLLLGLRKGAHGAGTWACPGGKPDPGEHPADTAIRELYEETGLEAAYTPVPVPFWHYNVFEDSDTHFVTVYYSVETEPDRGPALREPDKCAEWRWFDPYVLPNPIWKDTDKAIEAWVASR